MRVAAHDCLPPDRFRAQPSAHRLRRVTTRVLVAALDPIVARGLIQTLQDERYEVLDATDLASAGGLLEAVRRLHPDAVIVRMSSDIDALVGLLRESDPALRVIECDDDTPRLRTHPAGGQVISTEPVTAATLRQALGPPVLGGAHVH